MSILEILGYVVVNWETKKRLVLAWKFINLPKAQKPLDVHSWNLNTVWVLINAYKLGLAYHIFITKKEDTFLMKFIYSWLFCIAYTAKDNESNNYFSYKSKCYYI